MELVLFYILKGSHHFYPIHEPWYTCPLVAADTRSYNMLQLNKIPFECSIFAVYELGFVSEIAAGVVR